MILCLTPKLLDLCYLACSSRYSPILQDNEPLMRALSKLIYVNSPDLVLFVGEALVGNDAVDQLSKFNQVDSLFLCTCSHYYVPYL